MGKKQRVRGERVRRLKHDCRSGGRGQARRTARELLKNPILHGSCGFFGLFMQKNEKNVTTFFKKLENRETRINTGFFINC